jgi:hypothetical protein
LKALNAKSALSVQRQINPESIQKDGEKEISHSSKWAEYRRGLHPPRLKVLEKAEAKVEGSILAFNHPLWTILKSDDFLKRKVSLIKSLDPALQPILFDIHGKLIQNSNRHFLGKLERRASLDSLAALTILLKINLAEGKSEIAWEYAHSIAKVLILISKELDGYGVGEKILEFYCRHIFSNIRLNDKAFFDSKYLILLIFSYLLHENLNKSSDRPIHMMAPIEQTNLLLKLINTVHLQDYKKLFPN